LKVYNQLAGIFRTELQRNGKLNFARTKLQDYMSRVKRGELVTKSRWRTETIIKPDTVLDANAIYLQLKNSNDYLVRCEYSTLIIYTNNRNLLLDIVNKLKTDFSELWEPDPKTIDFLLNQNAVILTDTEVNFPYKITFGRKKANPQLASWIEKNGDKAQAGHVLMNNIRNSGFIQGQYIYVRDENIILLLQMLIGDNIQRIDKLVYKGNIDK
jgi:hypothetical protein